MSEASNKGIDTESFKRQKNKYLGKFIRTFNSIESSAYNLNNFLIKGLFPHQVIEILEEITLDDLNLRLKDHFNSDKMACSIIEPMGAQQSPGGENIQQ